MMMSCTPLITTLTLERELTQKQRWAIHPTRKGTLFVLQSTRRSQLATASTSLESGLVFAYLFDTAAVLHACDNQKVDMKVFS